MGNSTIVYVEDEEDYQKLVTRILGGAGLPVQIAGDGKEGLKLLERQKPDLLLLDINLPDTDGFSICRNLRQSAIWRDLPILMLTVRRRPEEWMNGFSSGADDYVSKPLNPPEFIERVRACLDGASARTAEGPDKGEYRLVQAAIAGNRGAFDILVRQYRPTLLRGVQDLIHNSTEVDDIVSSTFTQALERLHQFQGGSGFGSWLYGIALHQVYNRRRDPSLVSLHGLGGEEEEALPKSLIEPDPNVLAPEDSTGRLDALAALRELPCSERTLLKWRYAKGMSPKRIARRIGMSRGTVWSRVGRAKGLLRKAWDRACLRRQTGLEFHDGKRA
jgi:RNA polymerase sigma factor (sigma-70 family)